MSSESILQKFQKLQQENNGGVNGEAEAANPVNPNVSTEDKKDSFYDSSEFRNMTGNHKPMAPIFSLTGGGITNPLFQLPTGEYSDFLVKLKEKIAIDSKELIEKRGMKIQFHFIDKNNPSTAIACSTVVASVLDENRVFYYFFMLSCTGKEPMTSGELLSTFENNSKMLLNQPHNNPSLLKENIAFSYRTLDVYVDENYHLILTKQIASDYSLANYNQIEFIPVGGSIFSPLVTPANVDETCNTILKTSIVNLMIEKMVYFDKTEKDITVQDAFTLASRDYDFNIVVKNNPTNTKSEPSNNNHNPIRKDFLVQLHSNKKANTNAPQSYNRIDQDMVLCEAGGFVTAAPYVQTLANPQFPGTTVSKPRLIPHIVITDTTTFIPTLNFKLLTLAVACNMLNKNNWMQVLYNNIGTKNDPGNLNYVTNILDVEKQQDVQAIDFKTKKSPTEIYRDLEIMFSGHPMISLDILPYTGQSHIDKTFAIAAISREPLQREAALRDIINSAINLTNGAFNPNFDINRIFAMNPIPFPVGYTSIGNIVKDIRHIDLAFVCGTIKNDQQLLHTFLRSETPQNVEFDPFFGKIKTLTSIGDRSAVITGRGTRITFHHEFVTELTRAVQAAGLVPKFTEPTLFQASDYSYNAYNAFFQNATNANVSFGVPSMANSGVAGVPFVYSTFC